MMTQAYIIIDMQNDFISGALGTPEAQAIIPSIEEKIIASKKNTDVQTDIIFTQDTHDAAYLDTQEGNALHKRYKGLADLQAAASVYVVCNYIRKTDFWLS